MEYKTSLGIACLLALSVFVLSILPLTSALSVSPAKFEVLGDEEQTFVFTIRDATTVSVSFEGELAPYATVAQSTFMSSEKELRIPVRVDPPELSEGPHELSVIFRTAASEGQVGAVAELAPVIRYTKPYKGAFIDYDLGVQDANDPVHITLMLNNLGIEDTTVTPTFLFNKEVHVGVPVVVKQGITERLTYALPEVVHDPGVYNLTLLLSSSERPEQNNKEETIRVLLGTPEFSIQQITTAGALGGIVRIVVNLSIRWNEPFEATVTATVLGTGQQWVLQPQVTTIFRETPLTFFWESVGAEDEAYELELSISVLGASTEIMESFALGDEEMPVETKNILWILALIVLLLGLFVYVLLFKNK